METYEQKKRRLFGKQYLDIYLEELAHFLLINVSLSHLMSIVETDEVLEKNSAKRKIKTEKILFDDKIKLQELIIDLDIGYYLYTKYSLDCGAFKLASLRLFNFNFSFHSTTAGIITLFREDLKQKYVFDFYEEDNIRYMDIDVYECNY